MTDEEVMEIYEKMKDTFGDKLPNPEHQPACFMHYVKMYAFSNGYMNQEREVVL